MCNFLDENAVFKYKLGGNLSIFGVMKGVAFTLSSDHYSISPQLNGWLSKRLAHKSIGLKA